MTTSHRIVTLRTIISRTKPSKVEAAVRKEPDTILLRRRLILSRGVRFAIRFAFAATETATATTIARTRIAAIAIATTGVVAIY